MRLLLIVALTGACAQAHQEGFNTRPDSGVHVIDSNGGGGADGSNQQQIDAPAGHIDAPMQGGTQTLTETTSNTDTQIGIACGPTAGGYTLKNSYYRVFALSEYGITGTFHVTAVDFGVSGPAGNPPIKVSVGTYNGTTGGQTLTTSGITLTANAMINPGSADTTEHVPLTSDITGNLIVEIDQTADGTTANGYTFYPAANASGETHPGYIMAAGCSVNTPTSITSKAGAETDIVVTVTGST